METEGQWCDNASCPDCGQSGANNIKMHSYAERRFRCTTCHRTFSADKGTFFETLRTPRVILLDVHFISSLPVVQQNADTIWVDRKHVQSVGDEG
jgi:transposase-like protein